MATSLRLRLLCSVSLAAAWLTPLALPSVAGLAARAQDFAAQYPAGQDMQDLPDQDQPPGDDGGTPGRRPRSRGASKKGRRTPKGAAGTSEKAENSKKTAQASKETAASKTAESDAKGASADKARRNQAAKLSPKERDQKIEATGRERWRKANSKLKPEVVTGEHFMLFSNLPRDRAGATAKAMENQYNQLKRLLGAPATDWVEKVSLYVFSDRNDFVAFARGVENRNVDASVSTGGNLSAPQPYVVVVDPLGGKKEEPAAARRKARTKKAEEKEKEAPPGSDRSLLGLLSESLGDATLAAQGKTPRWLGQGFGAYLAAQVEPRSPYYQKLREAAHEKYTQGWTTKATEVFAEGNQASAEEARAVGFAIVECLTSPTYRPLFPAFARGMAAGKEKLDDVVKRVYDVDRDAFLNNVGEWVAEKYGQDQ